MKKYIVLAIVSVFFCQGSFIHAIGKLKVVNDTASKALIEYTKKGPHWEITGRAYQKTLEPHGDSFVVGDIDKILSIVIKSYGKVLGLVPATTSVDLSSIHAAMDQDAKIRLDSHIDPTGWHYTIIRRPITETIELPGTGDPYDAFPGAVKRRKLGLPIEPRHILGVPEGATREDIWVAFHAIAQKWDPEKHPDNPQFANKIMKILNDAKDKLLL